MDSYQNPELWVRELTEAGWVKHSSTVWMSPTGQYFRGPFKAWQLMCKMRGNEEK